jgi:ubiquinone/menaquinone biosynthesis C-methylase UbiE
MTLVIQLFLGLAIILLVFTVGWRLSSRRSSMPCPSWLGWLVELENPFARNYDARTIIQQLNLQPGMRVLDAGCGPGRVTVPLARALGSLGEVVAIDIQPRMLERAREKARAAGLTNIRFHELAIEEKELGNAQYDRVLLVAVFGEIPDHGAALREIHRALKPGGILSITETLFDPHYQRRHIILQLASPVGFHERAYFGNRFAYTVHLEKPTGT